jgi:hypothetical protein
MAIIDVAANYYEEFDADYRREVPAEGYGGWKKTPLPMNTETTALVVMHAWDCGTYEQYPGWYRAVEYIPRSVEISRKVFPRLLSTVRSSGMKVFHVAAGDNGYFKKYEGYRLACGLPGALEEEEKYSVEGDPAYDAVRSFKSRLGSHNRKDIENGFAHVDFLPEAKPVGTEAVAENTHQLYALCKHNRINHLVYAGFAIDWCLLLSPGGMQDMRQRGLLCSAVRQAVTAVENHLSARTEMWKELGLWRVAVDFGLVYDLDDLVKALEAQPRADDTESPKGRR